MIYGWLATFVLIVHAGFVAFVVAGGLLALRYPRAAWVHIPAAVWGIWIEWSGGICPLTPLENRLRIRAGQAGYAGDFLEHYLVSALYPEGLTREIQFILAAIVVVINAGIYAVVIRRVVARRRQRHRAGP